MPEEVASYPKCSSSCPVSSIALADEGMLPSWDKRQILWPPTFKGLVSPGLASGLALANRTQWAKRSVRRAVGLLL